MTRPQRGMTLIELIIAIVIIGIAAAAMFAAMASITGRSADPMLRQQSLMIAEGYLEEILSRSFLDPSSSGSTAACTGSASPRAELDDICDYQGWTDDGVHSATGEAVLGLEGYGVAVNVEKKDLNGVDALMVIVTVEDPSGQELQLTGWRTCYGEYDEDGNDACP